MKSSWTARAAIAWGERVPPQPGREATAKDTEPNVAGLHTSSPLYFKGRIYLGASSAENTAAKDAPCCTFRGHIDAYDAATGALVWRHYTVPAPHRAGSWPSGAARYEPFAR